MKRLKWAILKLRVEKEGDIVWLHLNNASWRHLSNRLDVIACQPSYWHYSAQCMKGKIQWDTHTSWSLCWRWHFHWPHPPPLSVFVSLRDRAQETDRGVAREEKEAEALRPELGSQSHERLARGTLWVESFASRPPVFIRTSYIVQTPACWISLRPDVLIGRV